MSSLLSLPREIRDQILDVVLDHEETEAPTALYARKWNTVVDKTDPTATKIKHSSLPQRPSSLHQVSNVNRQLRHETADALELANNIRPERPILKLDLLLDDLATYYTTWLRLPPYHGGLVRVLHIKIRTCFTLQYARDSLPSQVPDATATQGGALPFHAGQSGNPGPRAYVAAWRLGSVLNSLLAYGPSHMSRPSAGVRPRPLMIENLIVDIAGPDMDKTSFTDENDVECGHIARGQAQDLTAFMVFKLEELFTDREGGASHVPWGPFLLSRVREITITAYGDVLKRIDLAARAKTLGVALYEL